MSDPHDINTGFITATLLDQLTAVKAEIEEGSLLGKAPGRIRVTNILIHDLHTFRVYFLTDFNDPDWVEVERVGSCRITKRKGEV